MFGNGMEEQDMKMLPMLIFDDGVDYDKKKPV